MTEAIEVMEVIQVTKMINMRSTKRQITGRLSIASLALILFSSHFAYAQSAIGTWWTKDKESKIEIFEKEHKFFGKIVWLPADKMADKDIHNPKEALRSRDIIGLEFMTGFVKKGESFWGSGEIYDPKTGNTYDCKMTLTDPDTLEVRGFVGISLFGRTEKFLRVHEDNSVGTAPADKPDTEAGSAKNSKTEDSTASPIKARAEELPAVPGH